MSTTEARVSADELTSAIERARTTMPWLVPLIGVARDHGVMLGIIAQHAGAFPLPEQGRPFVLVIGDDMHEALGPDAFDRPSVAAALQKAAAVIVMASAPNAAFYAAAAGGASLGASVVIIETRPEQEIPWLKLLDEIVPKLPRLISTVRHGHA